MTDEDKTTSKTTNWLRKTVITILALTFALSIYLLSEAPMWMLINHKNTPPWIYQTYYVIYAPVDWLADTPIDYFLNKWWNLWNEERFTRRLPEQKPI